jgi:histidinol phosphatase-like PHP family hydrolase
MLNQDLHIHTIFSVGDGAVVPEQNLEVIASARHAKIVGISDHFESFMPERFGEYVREIRSKGFHVGTEVDGHRSVPLACRFDFEYYIYHCRDEVEEDYPAIDQLLETGKPVIIAHPYALNTDLYRIPESCYVEINNRYIWRFNWEKELKLFRSKFRWVLSSDAHQPHWLNQTIAKSVAERVGIKESILF